jgi:outer membrane protein assembly factor BamB
MPKRETKSWKAWTPKWARLWTLNQVGRRCCAAHILRRQSRRRSNAALPRSGRDLLRAGLFLLCAWMATLQISSSCPGASLPTEQGLRQKPALIQVWADRVLNNDRKVRAETSQALVQGGTDSLPLLKQFLQSRNEDLRQETFEIVRRIGPEAIPFLTLLLRHDQASIRRRAVSVLIDLAPDTESAQPVLCRALKDQDLEVARDAARALGALGKRAGPSVPRLVKALSHKDAHVRIYTAEALASIGPAATVATPNLAKALRDSIPGVRWAAGEALASFGPPASSAVPQLVEALRDEYLFVRICAAGALGSIRLKSEVVLDALKKAGNDPALRTEAEWALEQIGSTHTAAPVSSLSSVPGPNLVAETESSVASDKGNPPVDWDPRSGRNIVWEVALGKDTFGRPVVSGDVVYVGTDNARAMNGAFKDECGTLMAFRTTDGKFLWQDLAPRVERGLREFLLPSTTSAPYLEGNRLYYVTAECQLRCLDTQGFRDGKNDGPYQAELWRGQEASDIIWELDMCGRLGVFPHEACNSEVLSVGNLLLVCTSNGRNEGHTRMPSPRAPSLIAVNKHSGEVVWRALVPGENVLHGQWSSPVAATVNGRSQVLFGGGDGWLRAYDAASGRELWRFDGNPKPRPDVSSRGLIIASPVYQDGRVFLDMGQDPWSGNGPSLLHAISPNGQGDVTTSRRLWTCRDVGRVVGTPVVKDGLLYVGDLGGVVHCIDAATGIVLWKHETKGAIWGCLLLAKDRLYAGNVDGTMTVLRTGHRKEELARIEMDAPLYSRPALVGDTLYLATTGRLYRIEAKP